MSLTQVPSGMLQTTAQYYGFKNRIINGAMVISQYNGTSSVTPSGDTYFIDRFRSGASQTSKLTWQQNAGSVTPPAGFTNYIGVKPNATVSLGSGDYFQMLQRIEGFNVADFGWGTANAKTVTLSFWVYSNVTGLFGGSLENGSETRSYPYSYTISAANTWQYVTITIPGDTSGTWATDNTKGISINWNFGCGSTYTGTAGAWASAQYFAPTGVTSIMGSTSNYMYFTGIQLEVGTQATSFDYRPYTTELQLCQRYLPCWRVDSSGGNQTFGTATFQNGTTINVPLANPVQTRVPATGIVTSGTLLVFAVNSAYTISSPAFNLASTLTTNISGTSSSGNSNGSGVFAIQSAGSYIYGTGCEL